VPLPGTAWKVPLHHGHWQDALVFSGQPCCQSRGTSRDLWKL